MTREEAKRRAELYSALADGKAIQVQNPVTSKWEYLDINKIEELNYRIKPEPKYRPFKSQEECWQEMHQHPDFGWLYYKEKGYYVNINAMGDRVGMNGQKFVEAYSDYTFTDGAPFGVKEE